MSILDPASVVSPLGASVSSSVKWEDASYPLPADHAMTGQTPAELQASSGAWNPGTALVRSAGRQVGQRLRAHWWEWVHSARGVRMQDGPLLITETTVYSSKSI